MRAHLKHGAGLAGPQFGHAKSRVKKPSIMRPEFANPRVIGAHFSRMVTRHGDKFTACQNIKFVRIQHQPTGRQIRWCNTFPKRVNPTTCRGIDINQARMFARAPANHAAFLIRFEIYRQANAVSNINLAPPVPMHETDICVKRLHGIIRYGGLPLPQSQLR